MRLVNDEGEIDLETNAKQSFANKCVPKQSLGTSGKKSILKVFVLESLSLRGKVNVFGQSGRIMNEQ